MNKTLIITILANDRPGIVNTISETLVAHKASWIDSRMANLADKFAGLARVSVPAEHLHGLKDALQALHDADNQLQILMEDANEINATQKQNTLSLELIGADRPGIIEDITGVFVKLNVNINELESEQREAPMSSELLFWAKLQLGLPTDVNNDNVQDVLEALSDQLMVDINIGGGDENCL